MNMQISPPPLTHSHQIRDPLS